MAILFSGSNVEALAWLDSQPEAVGHCENRLGILLGLLEKELARREVPRKRIFREPGFRDDAADQLEISFGGEAVRGLHQFSAQGWVGEPYLVLFSACGTTTIFDDSRDSLPELMKAAEELGNLGGDPFIGKTLRTPYSDESLVMQKIQPRPFGREIYLISVPWGLELCHQDDFEVIE